MIRFLVCCLLSGKTCFRAYLAYLASHVGSVTCPLFTAGVSLGIQIDQSPSALIIKAGGNVDLYCEHKQTEYRVMLWYQLLRGDTALRLIGYGYTEFNNDSVEQPFKEHFKMTGDLTKNSKMGLLSISDAQKLKHTATYFCAASEPQHIKHPSTLYKNPFL